MGFFRSFFKKEITCPKCWKHLEVKKLELTGEVEILGKDEEGNVVLKHRGLECDANIIWKPLSGKTYLSDRK